MRPIRIEVYRRGMLSQWRWRARSGNGQIIATGGEGYLRKGKVLKILDRLFPDREAFPIEEVA